MATKQKSRAKRPAMTVPAPQPVVPEPVPASDRVSPLPNRALGLPAVDGEGDATSRGTAAVAMQRSAGNARAGDSTPQPSATESVAPAVHDETETHETEDETEVVVEPAQPKSTAKRGDATRTANEESARGAESTAPKKRETPAKAPARAPASAKSTRKDSKTKGKSVEGGDAGPPAPIADSPAVAEPAADDSATGESAAKPPPLVGPAEVARPANAAPSPTKSVGSSAGHFASGFLGSSASRIAGGYKQLGGQLGARFARDRADVVNAAPEVHVQIGDTPAATPSPTAAPPPSAGPTAPAGGNPADARRVKPKHEAVFKETPETDLGKPQRELGEASGTVTQQGDALAGQIAANPSAERVQPASVNERRSLELPPPKTEVKVEGSKEMDEFVALDLTPAARQGADRRMQSRLDQRLAGPRRKVDDATAKGERDREDAIRKTQDEAATLQSSSEQQQQGIVARARGEVEQHKQDGVDEARGAVAEFDKDAGERQRDTVDKANRRIDADQKRADDETDRANKKAEDERKKGEERKRKEREEAERKKKKRSFWQKIGDFFSKIFKALKKAITAIIDFVKKAVTAIFNALKKLVNGIVKLLASAIKKLLQVFAEVLKVLVDKLIGKVFPGIAAKLNAAIDATVELACQAVDAVAEAVEKAVDFLIEKATQIVEAAAAIAEAAVAAATALAIGLIKGDFLEALKEAFLAACEAVGLPGREILDLLAKAAKLIWEIIKKPAKFLGRLLKSIWGGMKLFIADIVPNFLRGLMGWIFGEVAATGIEIPKKFDLQGILGIVLQVIGLSMANVRAQAVNVLGNQNVELAEGAIKFVGILFAKGPGAFFKQIVTALKALPNLMFESAANWAEQRFGERGRTVVEGLRANFEALMDGGPSALWAQMKSQLSSIKDAIIDGIRDWVVTKIVTIAVEKITTMTNPVGGFIQAIIMIYRTIKFFVQRIKQILALVNKILDSIGIVAKGMIKAASQAINKTMIAGMPLMITFMADLIGLGGIGEKVRKIIAKIQEPVNKALVWLFAKIKKGVEWVFAKIKALAGRARDKFTKRGKPKTAAPEGEPPAEPEVNNPDTAPDERTPEEKSKALESAKEAIRAVSKPGSSTEEIASHFPEIVDRFKLRSLGFVKNDRGGVSIRAAINPTATIDLAGVSLGSGNAPGFPIPYQTRVEYGAPRHEALLGAEYGWKMEAHLLGPDHHQGSPPSQSALAKMMSFLPTDPKQASTHKYIKGHLLNGHLGGPGDDVRNLTPFTASVNRAHLDNVETHVKQWVNLHNNVAYYKVEVSNEDLRYDASSNEYHFDSDISYEAYQIDATAANGRYGPLVKGSIRNQFGIAALATDQSQAAASGGNPIQEKRPVELEKGHSSDVVLTPAESIYFQHRSVVQVVPQLANITAARLAVAGVSHVADRYLTKARSKMTGQFASSEDAYRAYLSHLGAQTREKVRIVIHNFVP